MRRRGRSPIFVERRGYRRRRMMDAARLLPVLGAVLFLLPLLWAPSDLDDAAAAPAATSHTYIYLFVVWAALIVLAGVLSRGAGQEQDATRASGDDG